MTDAHVREADRGWALACPQCKRTYVVPFKAPWSCPNGSGKHGPIRVERETIAAAAARLAEEGIDGRP